MSSSKQRHQISPDIIAERVDLSSCSGPVLGMDFGLKRIGFAVSDKAMIIASPYCVHNCCGMKKDSEFVAKIIEKTGAKLLVVGMPIDTYNKVNTDLVCSMYKLINETNKLCQFKVFMQDERFSTRRSILVLKEAGLTRKQSVGIEDKISASYILQDALDLAAKLKSEGD